MKYIICLLLLTQAVRVKAQTANDSIKQTINILFSAMKASDGQLLQSVFADSAILQTITQNKATGHTTVKTSMVGDFVKQIAALPVNAADERIEIKAVLIDGDLASVWTPYQFYFNKKFSHCGVNSFQLVRINGIWKIQYLIDTRRKNNCPD